MPAIQSSVGLITGLQITEIVDQLMEIAAQPRDRLQSRTTELSQQQVAIGELTALTIGTQLAASKLGNAAIFQQRTATSSNPSLLSGTVTGDAVPGTYQFTPVRMAQNHQMVSTGVANLQDAVGAGTLKLRLGGFADASLSLDALNGGRGVERGKIAITDRSGNSATIDLRFALTIDEVINQINNSADVNVRAEVAGDAIRLVDLTGQSVTNLSVRDVAGGNTAADLGLAGINVAASQATGQDVVRLYDALAVSELNDRTGLSLRDELPDLNIQFQDGSTLEFDVSSADITTVGDLLAALNAADPTRLSAAIGADGNRLVLTDLTVAGGGTFSVSSAVGSTLAEDLGLTGSAAGNVLTGARIMSPLKGPLLASLAGGSGLAALGQLQLTDRSGATATVNLTGAETLDAVISLINDAGIGITAAVNDARNGLVLRDTTGATASNLIVANADATNSADALGIAVNAAQTSVDSGSLRLQVIHEGVRLETLNNGRGVSLGSILITDSNGQTSGVNLRTSSAKTVGDVLDLINGLDLAVEARINETGDGILLVDTGSGSGTMEVRESGTGTTAADLRLLGTATVVDLGGTPTQVIDGTTTTTVTIDDDDTLQDVVDKINELNLGITANVFQGGSGAMPYRMTLSSTTPGAAGEMLVDASQWQLGFYEIAAAQDAVLQVGSADVPGAGVLATSSTNQFSKVINGVNLTIGGVSDSPVAITVSTTDQNLVSGVKSFVEQFNKLRDKIDDLTFFDAETETTGILMGSGVTLQIESRLTRILTSRFFGAGEIQSLEELGISFTEEGRLELDETKLTDKFEANPDAVKEFFTNKDVGFVKKFNDVVDSLAGEDASVLMSRTEALQRRIEDNGERIAFFNSRLEVQRERLFTYYYNLELAISKIQANMSVVQSLAAIPTTTTRTSNS